MPLLSHSRATTTEARRPLGGVLPPSVFPFGFVKNPSYRALENASSGPWSMHARTMTRQPNSNTHEQAVLELARARPLLRARDLAQQELPTIVLSRLVAAGKLERVARGVYGLPGSAISEHRSLVKVALRVPQGVVCLLSALRVHDIGTQAPFEVWHSNDYSNPGAKSPPMTRSRVHVAR